MGRNLSEIMQYLLDNHRGKLFGLILGLVLGILIISFGFWKTVLVILCIVIGLFFGKRFDEDGDRDNWWDRLIH